MFVGMGSPKKLALWRMARSGTVAPDSSNIVQRARPFGAAVHHLRGAAIVSVRGASDVNSFLLAPWRGDGESSKKAASHLANSVGARAVPEDQLPDLSSVPAMGRLVARPQSVASRDSQSGADPTEVARLVARVAQPGSWVAATLRKPTGRELTRTRDWYRHRLAAQTHHTNEGEAVVATLYAGGRSADEVRSLLTQVAAALPGFDIEVSVEMFSKVAPMTVWSALSLGLWGGAGVLAPDLLPGMQWGPLSPGWDASAALSIPPALVSLGVATDTIPTRASRMRRRRDDGRLPAPARNHGRVRKPHGEKTQADGRIVPAFGGDYPLAATSFLLGPSVLVGLAAPHAGAASGANVTESRSAPPALLDDIGPVVGFAGEEEQQVHASARDQIAGTGIMGIPGAGKSVLVRLMYAWNVLERVAPSSLPGRPGERNALIAFENKGDGAQVYQRWASTLGDTCLRVDLADAATPAIDVFDVPGDARQRASLFVNAMKYAFEDGAIQERSFETLMAVVTAAQLVTPEMAKSALMPPSHPVIYAHVLLCGNGDEAGVRLAEQLFAAAAEASDVDTPAARELVAAVRALGPLYGPKVNPGNRRTLCEAPRSKIGLLAEADMWWDPDRPTIAWRDVLRNHLNVVVNTGVTDNGVLVTDHLTGHMSSVLMYCLKDAIMRNCSGWDADGRSVSIFADELSLLAGSSPEVISWLRAQGRSYGVRPVLATQWPDQLTAKVRSAVMSFGTFFWFTQNNVEVVAEAVRDLSVDGSLWTEADISGLGPYRAVVRAQVGKQRQPAVPVSIAWWEDDMGSFAAFQGYPPTAPVDPDQDTWGVIREILGRPDVDEHEQEG